MATGFTLRASGSNKSRRISATRSFHQVTGTQVEVSETVPEKTVSRAVIGVLAETPTTKELKKYVNAAEDNFKIDHNYSPGQRMTELFDSDKKSLSSIHESKVSGL